MKMSKVDKPHQQFNPSAHHIRPNYWFTAKWPLFS